MSANNNPDVPVQNSHLTIPTVFAMFHRHTWFRTDDRKEEINRMGGKALYRNIQSGDLFAIETDGQGKVLSTSGPLLSEKLDPKVLDYDEYWNMEIQAKLPDFERITRDDFIEILRKNGFVTQFNQKHLF